MSDAWYSSMPTQLVEGKRDIDYTHTGDLYTTLYATNNTYTVFQYFAVHTNVHVVACTEKRTNGYYITYNVHIHILFYATYTIT